MDCDELVKLFYQTVHTVNAKDYTKEQLTAWSPDNINSLEWNESFLKNYTIIAIDNDEIVGFGDKVFLNSVDIVLLKNKK